MVAQESLRGVTSNPSIFEKSILGTSDYDDAMRELARADMSAQAIYDGSRSATCRARRDVLAGVHEESGGRDGFVSLEVMPDLAHDTDGTLGRPATYWQRLDRPNVMIKIPGTAEGVPAIEQAIYEGINVNVTLLFAVEAYEAVARGYIRGLERRHAEGKSLDVNSVASFFVSRVDTQRRQAARRARARPTSRARPRSPTRGTHTGASGRSSPAIAGSGWRPPAPRCSGRCGPRPASRTPPTRTRMYVDNLSRLTP